MLLDTVWTLPPFPMYPVYRSWMRLLSGDCHGACTCRCLTRQRAERSSSGSWDKWTTTIAAREGTWKGERGRGFWECWYALHACWCRRHKNESEEEDTRCIFVCVLSTPLYIFPAHVSDVKANSAFYYCTYIFCCMCYVLSLTFGSSIACYMYVVRSICACFLAC